MYPIKKKSYVFLIFKNFKARVELESGKRIMCLRMTIEENIQMDIFSYFASKHTLEAIHNCIYTTRKWCSRDKHNSPKKN